jgi:anti-sigma B factor antagonist
MYTVSYAEEMVETKTQQIGDVTVVEMSGRLHLGNSLMYAENAINRLIEGGTRKLVIDLARLEHLDSSGLGMLIGCSGRMEQNGGRMRVACAGGPVAQEFSSSTRISNRPAAICRQNAPPVDCSALLRNHPDRHQPRLYQVRPARYRKLGAPQPEGMLAFRV